MKFSNASPLGLVLCITVLLSGACSSHRIIPTSPSASAQMNTPAQQPVNVEPKQLNTPTPAPTLLPFTGKIAFLGGRGNWVRLYVMNANGTGLTEITPLNLLWISGVSWSPGAQYIAFEAITDPHKPIHQIYKINADGSDLKQITSGQQSSRDPSWSPDGKNIIFAHENTNIQNKFGWYPEELDIMKSDGTEVRKLVDDVTAYSFRSDGSISVSIPATRDLTKTYIINSEGAVQDQLPNFPNRLIPEWSPDGKTIVSSDIYRTGCSGIIVMKSDGSDEVCLKIEGITPPTEAGGAKWSPDGKYIIFSANPGGKSSIYLVKPDGTDLIQLVNLEDVGEAVWSAGQ